MGVAAASEAEDALEGLKVMDGEHRSGTKMCGGGEGAHRQRQGDTSLLGGGAMLHRSSASASQSQHRSGEYVASTVHTPCPRTRNRRQESIQPDLHRHDMYGRSSFEGLAEREREREQRKRLTPL